MRILVLSDIHANAGALEAVLKAAGKFDALWCLGDLVGYGPDPNECIDIIRSCNNLTCLLGNHDAAAIGQIPLVAFNLEARDSVQWAQNQLTEINVNFLKGLQPLISDEKFTLAHGSPRNPIWEYILDLSIAQDNFDFFTSKVCLVGHTHIPAVFYYPNGGQLMKWKLIQKDEVFRITGRAILNPGSVGQPRDRDARAAFAIYSPEDNLWEARRIEYDYVKVQKRIQQYGLPSRNADRLAEGW